MKSRKVCIIGAEGWGSALATAIGKNALKEEFDARVHIYVYDELVRYNYLSEVMNDQHENIKYLPGIKLPPNLIAVNDLLEAARNADILIFATPESFVKSYCNILEGKIKSTAFAVSMIKGLDHIEDGEIGLFSQAISKQLNIPCYSMMCANSAMEMAQGKLCEITIGCNNTEHARLMTTVFQTDNCKVVATNDVHGVELCGTLKDIIALGAGFIDGLRLGDNCRVAALHLGLKEMLRFVKTFYPTARISTFFESCGMANSVASSYADKNVTFAKCFVTSGKTVQEIEANLLNGRKLLGPIVAQAINAFLKKENMLEEFPLFAVIHKICQKEVNPMEIVDALRNHPDLNTSSISQLMDKEHQNATQSMLENVPDTVSEPFSLGPIEEECITLSETQENWKPFYQYFTPNEANRIRQELIKSPLEEELEHLNLNTCKVDEQNISLVLEEHVDDAAKPVVASGTSTAKSSNSTNAPVYNDFRIVSKRLSTDNKGGPPIDPSKNTLDLVAKQGSSGEVDALDLSADSKMDDWIVDNAWLSDQLPPSVIGNKVGKDITKKATDEDVAQQIKKLSKPKDNEYQTLNVKVKPNNSTEAADTSVAVKESQITGRLEEKKEDSKNIEIVPAGEEPFAAFDGIQNFGSEEKTKLQSEIFALDNEISELELKQPTENVSEVLSESKKGSSISDETPVQEMKMIYDKDATLDTDFKDYESEITNLSNTMHLKETEFLQQELAKLHQTKSIANLDKELNDLKLLIEKSGQEDSVQSDYNLLKNETQQSSDSPTIKATEEPDRIFQPYAEFFQSESQKNSQLEENLNNTENKQLSSEQTKEIKMEFKDKSNKNTEYLVRDEHDKLELTKSQTVDFPLKPHSESPQVESQEQNRFEAKSLKPEGKHLSKDPGDVRQAEKMQFEDKSVQNLSKLVNQDDEKMELPDTESSDISLRSEQSYSKSTQSDSQTSQLFEDESDKQERRMEKMQFEEKSNQNSKYLDNDRNQMEIPKAFDDPLRSVQSVAESKESESQTSQKVKDTSEKLEDKHLSSDHSEGFSHVELGMEDKSAHKVEYLVENYDELKIPEAFDFLSKAKQPYAESMQSDSQTSQQIEGKSEKSKEQQSSTDPKDVFQLEKPGQKANYLDKDNDKLKTLETETFDFSLKTEQPYAESMQSDSLASQILEGKSDKHMEKYFSADPQDVPREEMQFKEKSGQEANYLETEDEKLKIPQSETFDISLETKQPNTESMQSDSQTSKQLEEMSDKRKEKQFTTDADEVPQLKLQMKDKSAENAAYLANKDNDILKLPENESFNILLKPLEFSQFQSDELKETSDEHNEKHLSTESEDIDRMDKMQVEKKPPQNMDYLADSSAYAKMKLTDSESLDVSVRSDSKHESLEKMQFEEKPPEQEDHLLSEIQRDLQLEEKKFEDKSTENTQSLNHDDSENSESTKVKSFENIPNLEDTMYRREIDELKEDDKLITWLRNYSDNETGPSNFINKQEDRKFDVENLSNNSSEKMVEVSEHEWDWLRSNEKLDEGSDVVDERQKEFYFKEKDVTDLEQKLELQEETLVDERQTEFYFKEKDETDLEQKLELQEEPLVDERQTEFYFKEQDVSDSEQKLELHEETQSQQMVSETLDEPGLSEERYLPLPIHQTRRKVTQPETPAVPAPKPTAPKEATPMHLTQPRSIPPPSPQTHPLAPQQKQPIRKDMPIKSNVSDANEKVTHIETAELEKNKGGSSYPKRAVPSRVKTAADRPSTYRTDSPSVRKRKTQEEARSKREKSRPLNIRAGSETPQRESAEVEINNERHTSTTTKTTPSADNVENEVLKADKERLRTSHATRQPAPPRAEEDLAAHPSKRKESKMDRITKKLNSIMRRGQEHTEDKITSSPQSKKSKVRPKSTVGTRTQPSELPKLNEGAGTNVGGHRRRLPVKPSFTPPLNPRVRIPRPPFDARDHEYHTMARSYGSPSDLTRLQALLKLSRHPSYTIAQLATSQRKQMSTINMPVPTQVRGGPSFQIPKGLLRSPSLAKIVSAIQLGLLAKYLTCYKQS